MVSARMGFGAKNTPVTHANGWIADVASFNHHMNTLTKDASRFLTQMHVQTNYSHKMVTMESGFIQKLQTNTLTKM
jgi:hypothetical protein